MECILRGSISITDNLMFVREMMYTPNNNLKIITLDELGSVPTDHPNVLSGTCLLPPIDALMAEADGNEELYDSIYMTYFSEDSYVIEFMAALLMYLYKGGDLLLYYPELDTNTAPKLSWVLWVRYGISIGIVNQRPHQYDMQALPIWLNEIYFRDGMSYRDYLRLMPDEVLMCLSTNPIIDKLLLDIAPLGDSFNSKIEYIISLGRKFKEKPDLIIPFKQVL